MPRPSPPRHCPDCGSSLRRRTDRPAHFSCPGCGRAVYDSPVPVVAAVVELGDEVVLVRGHGWREGIYGLVAGFLEPNEAPETGIAREIGEELGLAAERVELIGAYAFPAMNQVIIGYGVTAAGVIVPGAEIAGWKRVPAAKLRAWETGTGLVVRDWLRTHGMK
jgi:NAD+ diphosphatase